MLCPYSDCRRDIQAGRGKAHCPTCRRPVATCRHCQTPNSTLARHCRKCGEPSARPSYEYLPQEKLAPRRAGDEHEAEPRVVEVNDVFWVAPVEYAQFLWFLSLTGQVYRLSLFADQPEYVGTLGEGFGRAPFLITEFFDDASQTGRTPYLLAANRGRIVGINLLNHQSRQFLRLGDEEYLLADISKHLATVTTDGRRVSFLKKFKQRERQTYLSTLDLLTDQIEDHALGDKPAAGPFKVAGGVGVYFNDRVRVLTRDGIARDYRLPRNFYPWVAWEDSQQLRPPMGRMPFLSRGQTVYIPGRRAESDASEGVAGLHLITLVNGSQANTDFVPAEGETSYLPDPAGRPVVARRGAITVYDGESRRVVKALPDLTGDGPAYHDEELSVGFVARNTNLRDIRLRFEWGSHVFTYPLAEYHSDYDGAAGGFYRTAASVAFLYRTAARRLRLLIWDTYAG
jgi:hypothetical protein